MASIIAYTKAKMDQLLGLKANVADAVPLAGSGDLPLNDGPVAFQGSASIAARSDHIHHLTAPYGYPIPEPAWNLYAHPLGHPTSTAIDDGKCPVSPFPVPRGFTLKTIYVSLYTAADAGTFALAIYASNTHGLPEGAPLWQSPDTAATGTGLKTIGSLTVDLTDPGLYFVAMGAKGYSTTRPKAKIIGVAKNEFMPVNTDVQWTPGLFLSTFNETTGAFPTIPSGAPNYVSTSNSNTAFWYAIQGTPA
jgi:hypothetical protein